MRMRARVTHKQLHCDMFFRLTCCPAYVKLATNAVLCSTYVVWTNDRIASGHVTMPFSCVLFPENKRDGTPGKSSLAIFGE